MSLNLRTQILPDQAKRHVLHIEDDPEVAAAVGQLLEGNGYAVTHAADGLPRVTEAAATRRRRNISASTGPMGRSKDCGPVSRLPARD